MKTIAKKTRRRAAFTIVELLTVMSIIVILIGLLVPALNRVRIFAREVKQNAQFHSIEAAIELFNNAFEGYPESYGDDITGASYCGAMKLCEAMMGQDLLGFHPDSAFRADGQDAAGATMLYNPTDLASRKGPYLPPESADAVEIQEIWTAGTAPFLATSRVLCDVYTRKLDSGKKIGMPILYYKAETRGMARLHDASLMAAMTPRDSQGNIYNFLDNQELLDLGVPITAGTFDLSDPERFYKNTLSDKIKTTPRPFKADTYILISAGYDGEYGTADDICNFDWKYIP
ncbi:MAG: type II secretion system protein [Sedimentisphaerales bacterium]|nr:type II secretion system protein [Sedimentisphaerales bacterium]